MPKRVIYGESNYAAIVHKHGYFVDKTAYMAQLEAIENPVFLRQAYEVYYTSRTPQEIAEEAELVADFAYADAEIDHTVTSFF